jgi:uncharacterized membrane protein (DUF485 family)
MSTPDLRHTPSPEEFIEAQRSPEFQELRKKQRGFAFPVTICALLWFGAYVVLAMFTPDLFSGKVLGEHQRRSHPGAAPVRDDLR